MNERNDSRLPVVSASKESVTTGVPSTTIEPKTDSISPEIDRGADAVDKVFLTPRVIDCESYESFAGNLRILIDRAANLQERLEQSTARAETASNRCTSDLGTLDQRLNLGGRLLRSLEAQINRVQAAAKTTIDEVEALHERVDSFDGQATERINKFRLEVQEITKRGRTRLARDERDIAERLSANKAELASMRSEWQQQTEDLEQRLGHIDQRLRDDLGAKIEKLEVLHDKVAYLIGDGSPATELSASDDTTSADPTLAEYVARGEMLRDEAAFAAKQAEALRTQWDQLRKEMGTELLGAAEVIDELDLRRLEMQQSITDGLASCRAEKDELESRASSIRETWANSPLGECDAATFQQRVDAINAAMEGFAAAEKRLAQMQENAEQLVELEQKASARLAEALDRFRQSEPILQATGSGSTAATSTHEELVAAVREIVIAQMRELQNTELPEHLEEEDQATLVPQNPAPSEPVSDGNEWLPMEESRCVSTEVVGESAHGFSREQQGEVPSGYHESL